MANYRFPSEVMITSPVDICDANYTFTAEYLTHQNKSFALITVASSCGGGLVLRSPVFHDIHGDAATDPLLMAQLQTIVDDYMASLEV